MMTRNKVGSKPLLSWDWNYTFFFFGVIYGIYGRSVPKMMFRVSILGHRIKVGSLETYDYITIPLCKKRYFDAYR